MNRRLIIGIILGAGLLVIGIVLYAIGILSTPRDYSSPAVAIHILDKDGHPITNLEVDRNWYDSDCGSDGDDKVVTNQDGVYRFPKIPAKVCLFTGAGRKAIGSLASCGTGSGTYTTIFVRFHGQCTVAPQDKSLHPAGKVFQDSDGVYFYQGSDSLSNSTANLSFPGKMTNIDYTLSSIPVTE